MHLQILNVKEGNLALSPLSIAASLSRILRFYKAPVRQEILNFFKVTSVEMKIHQEILVKLIDSYHVRCQFLLFRLNLASILSVL